MKDHTSTSLDLYGTFFRLQIYEAMFFFFPLLFCDMSHEFQKNADDAEITLSISIGNEKLILKLFRRHIKLLMQMLLINE